MGRRFLAERRRDPYYRAAQREGLRSRAAFKLAYLDERFHLFRPRARVLDLGAAPGGWSVVARDRVGPRGMVVAVDLRPIEPIEGVRVVRGRVGDPALPSHLPPEPFDLVLSDMSPRISGAYATDHARSVGLVEEALRLALTVLRPGGAFVAKVFDGDLVTGLQEELRRSFEEVRRTKPPASREPSSEVYLVARGRRPGGKTQDRVEVPTPRAFDI
ncbi:MAG TPA: RlmE family RNA methyltransferase [Thermoplasmata archaeon]|nr:RlmE family RNA methyltransferase [Thermoplasmata archaeon]